MFAMFGLGPAELMVLGVVAVLLFGSKLPEVARSMGKSYNEFKRGLNDVQGQFREAEREANRAVSSVRSSLETEPEESYETTAPKFVPPGENDSAGIPETNAADRDASTSA